VNGVVFVKFGCANAGFNSKSLESIEIFDKHRSRNAFILVIGVNANEVEQDGIGFGFGPKQMVPAKRK
jgi:hypothetical protein